VPYHPSRARRLLHPFPTRRSSDLGLTRTRQQLETGDEDFRPRCGGPGIDIGVGGAQFDIPDIKITGDVEQRVFLANRMNFIFTRSEEHTSELQSRENLVCRLLLDK